MRVRCSYQIVLIFVSAFLYSIKTTAQSDTINKNETDAAIINMFSTGLGIQHGFIFAHSPKVENTKGSRPTGIEVILSWQRNDANVWNLCNCYPRRGMLLSYYDYDNQVLGKGLTAAYFLEPVYRLGRKTFFSFRASAGFSYLTRPYDSIRHPNNRSYSTHMNAYLLVGLGVWIRLNDHWWLNPSINYNHESNGGMKQPNSGINWPTAGVTISYQKDPRSYYTGTRSREKYWKDHSPRYEFGIFGSFRRALDPQGNSLRLPLIGLSFQAAKQVGRINVLTIGTEVFKDWALKHQLKQDTIEASHIKAGILAGHEFILGRFLFSQRLGFYVFDQTPDFDNLYHRWGLMYKINRRIAIGVNLSAHRHIADFSDLKVTYIFQKRY
jgi:hypothetical protein